MPSQPPSTLRQGYIPTIFQGVSRQPDSVRFPGQVEDGENVDFSVETGGFAPRLGLRLRKKISGMSPGAPRRLHLINRDVNEKYRMVLSNGGVRIFDKDYVEKTVTVDAGNTTWLSADPDNFTALTAVDYTFIAKKTDVVSMDNVNLAPVAPSMGVVYAAQGYAGNTGNIFKVRVNDTVVANITAGSSDDSTQVANSIRAAMVTSLGAAYTVTVDGSYIFVKRNDGTAFTMSQASPSGDTGLVVIKDAVDAASKAPAKALHGMMLNVKGSTGDGYWMKFVADNGVSGNGVWRETVEPGSHIKFNASTMPRGLIRNEDGTFTLSTLTWDDKVAGTETEVPAPDFVDDTINDIIFSRNRLGLVTGETVYWSEAGSFFNFWPKTATELNEADPFGLSNSTNSISKFYYAIPFRRSVFVMADNAQFEIGGQLLTATHATIDLATSYSASPRCRPVAVGDELYFPVELGGITTLLSYVYDEASVSETANDVTKHVTGFVPSPLVEIAADSIQNKVICLSDSDRDALYVHTFFYQGQDRVQSAWSRHQFDDLNILSIGMLDGVVNLLVEYDGSVWLAELPLRSDIYSDFDWVPRLDYHQMLTGTYDSGTGRTTWSLGYHPTSPAAITSNLFPSTKRMLSLPLTISGTSVSASGDWSAYPVMVGETFDSFVDFSKQFVRDPQGSALFGGRLALKNMTLNYVDSGYFRVEVTPYARSRKTKYFTARRLGNLSNRVQNFPIESGQFRFSVNSNAETVAIRVTSDTFLPYIITSAEWVGDFTSKVQG